MYIGEEIQVHEIEPAEVPYEGEEIDTSHEGDDQEIPAEVEVPAEAPALVEVEP